MLPVGLRFPRSRRVFRHCSPIGPRPETLVTPPPERSGSTRGTTAPARGEMRHRFTTRIYYADTDFSGVVYHGRYLEFLERGRSDLLHEAGIRHRDLAAGVLQLGDEPGEPLAWVVRRMTIDYRGSARIEDEIAIETGIAEARGARLVMPQRITLHERPILEASVEAALVTMDGRPRRIPSALLERIGLP